MKNEPNFKTSRIEYQESSIENMRNKPNFSPILNPPWFTGNQRTEFTRRLCGGKKFKTNPISLPRHRRYTQTVHILPSKSLCFSSTFHQNSPKSALFSQLFVVFCNFLTLTYLTPYISKAYTTFCQGIPLPALSKVEGPIHEMRDKKICKTNPI
jgi:hypothetical protein